MPRRAATHRHQESNPRRQTLPPWGEPCRNKRHKKRVLQGQCDSGNKRASKQKDRKCRKKKRKVGHPIPVVSALMDCFSEMKDPRIDRRRRHSLIAIIVIAVLAVIANADTWKDIQIWGVTHQEWLKTFLKLPNGVPSRDTFRRTISRIAPDQFQQAFLRWLGSGRKGIKGVIAIDGKTLRRSGPGDLQPLHIVSAWACEQHLTLGQRVVDGKSNEITAIPQLLETLLLKGSTVTIDAMGCQKEIAAQIVDAKGDYCLAVKDNQPMLASDVRKSFLAALETDFRSASNDKHETHDSGHGRTETRYFYTMPVPESMSTAHHWKGLKSIGMTITYRSENCDGEIRYYINSFASDAKRFAKAVRGHWGIENSLHWVMDVTFGEDESRIHKDHGGENVSWLRRLAISLIKQETSLTDSIRAKRVRAGYDVAYLQRILESISTEI